MQQKIETIKAIEIPQSHINFANSVAELAEKNGITEFVLEYEPHWQEGEQWDRRVRGKAKIHFRAKDGRGRPCRYLAVSLDAAITHEIEKNEESSN